VEAALADALPSLEQLEQALVSGKVVKDYSCMQYSRNSRALD
jgi:hypothetical protein